MEEVEVEEVEVEGVEEEEVELNVVDDVRVGGDVVSDAEDVDVVGEV